METDEMNFQILKNAADALLPKGKLIFTTLNALFLCFIQSRIFWIQKQEKGLREPTVFHLIL